MITVSQAANAGGYYVYSLRDPSDGTVFYIGKGHGWRASKHLSVSKNEVNKFKVNKIRKIREYGYEPVIGFIAIGLSEESAFRIERNLISIYGRRDIRQDGTLTNLTDGGEGKANRIFSDSTRNLLSIKSKGRKCSCETRAKISATLTGRKQSPVAVARRAESITGKPRSEETKAKISASSKGRRPSDNTIAAYKEYSKTRVISDETRAKLSSSRKGKPRSEETKAKISQSHMGMKHSEESIAKMRRVKREAGRKKRELEGE